MTRAHNTSLNPSANDTDTAAKSKPAKRAWEKPQLIELGKDLSDVGGPTGPFSDGFGGQDLIDRGFS